MGWTDQHVDDVDLVARLDQELSGAQATVVDAHLAACEQCRTRADELRAATLLARLALRAGRAADDHARTRASLARALEDEQHPDRSRRRGRRGLVPIAAVVAAMALVIANAWRDGGVGEWRTMADALPIARLTPGATASLTAAQLCSGEQPSRSVPTAIARRVVRAYAMEDLSPAEYKLDALITPELGGTVAAENLWPQRYAGGVWTAYVKDEIEDHLRTLVCGGELDLATAQHDMASNWIGAYKKYLRRERPATARRPLGADADLAMMDAPREPLRSASHVPRIDMRGWW